MLRRLVLFVGAVGVRMGGDSRGSAMGKFKHNQRALMPALKIRIPLFARAMRRCWQSAYVAQIYSLSGSIAPLRGMNCEITHAKGRAALCASVLKQF